MSTHKIYSYGVIRKISVVFGFCSFLVPYLELFILFLGGSGWCQYDSFFLILSKKCMLQVL